MTYSEDKRKQPLKKATWVKMRYYIVETIREDERKKHTKWKKRKGDKI